MAVYYTFICYLPLYNTSCFLSIGENMDTRLALMDNIDEFIDIEVTETPGIAYNTDACHGKPGITANTDK